MSSFSVSLSPHVRDSASTRRIMLQVCLALLPALAFGVWAFGLYALLVVALSVASAVGTEALVQRCLKRPITTSDGSAAVTGLLLGLTLPPEAPWYVPVFGAVFAIFIAKQVFGGLGDNFVNPALAGRAFLLACWPVEMTSYPNPFAVDALTSATPLADAGFAQSAAALQNAYLGFVPGTIGETCKLALLLGAAYLLLRRVIDWRIPVAYLGSLALLSWAFGENGLLSIGLGGVILGAFFMATDYVTSPITPWGKLVYGVGCGLITFAIRTWGAYPEGVTYAILLMNVAAPLIDRGFRPRKYGEVKEHA